MFKQLNIMLCFLLFFSFDRATAQDNFEIFVPNYIPVNSSFEISIITSKKFPATDKLELYFSTGLSLNINKIMLLTQNNILQLEYHNEFSNEFNKDFKKISIDLSDSTNFSDNSFFQLIISLKSNKNSQNNLTFFGKFYDGKNVLGYLKNSDIERIDETENLYNLTFQYYQKKSVAEKSLFLVHGSYLNIPIVCHFEEYLIAEFWMKINNPASSIIEIINWESNRVEYSLSVNENQMLIINTGINDVQPAKPFFISENCWYHFKIAFDKINSELVLYCGDIQLINLKVNNDLDFENVLIHFQNESAKSEINLEQFRLISCDGNLNAIERSKNYTDYIDDKSEVLLQLDFNEQELNDLLQNKVISYEEIKFVKSDAPIFPRSPEINVMLSENYYEIKWEGGNYENAYQYILERATGENDFMEIEQLPADNDERKTYSLISEKVEQPEIVYFRIKQINTDGSVVYSDVAKVGQGVVHDLIIGQNYPNPFNPKTLIQFELIQDSDVEVKVYNLAGKEVALLHKGLLTKGVHQFEFDGSGLSSGLYFYQITTPLGSQTRKMILAK